MKCYKIAYKTKNLIKNNGFYIVGLIIILYFITLFIFITKSFNVLYKEIYIIVLKNKNNNIPLDNNSIPPRTKIKRNKKSIKYKINIRKKDKFTKNLPSKSMNKSTIEIYNGQIMQNNKINIRKIRDKKDFELNSLCYESALKLDHRTYFEYYISLIKNSHPIIFSFVPYNDYNSKIIKMFLFFFSFSLDFTVNALFFNDDTMNKIYQDKGQFNFLYQIPQILYSTLISRFIDCIIKNFALTQEDIVQLKEEKDKSELDIRHKKLIKKLKIKFILYFILTFFVLLFFWYYITCFCGIYVNTQSHLIKDSLLSIITSLLIPFGLCLIPGIFRVSALRYEKPNRKCLYKFSMFLENWIV